MPSKPHTYLSVRLFLSIVSLFLITIVVPQALAQATVDKNAQAKGLTVELIPVTRVATPRALAQQDCIGPGSLLNLGLILNNPTGADIAATATITLAPGLLAIPGSCTVTGCSIVNASTVSFAGTVPANGSVSILFQAQVGDLVPPETTLCFAFTVTVGGGTPITGQGCVIADCPLVGPGLPFAGLTDPSDQKAGSVLVFNLYASSISQPLTHNSRINITNTEPSRSVAVHLFFVDGNTCSITDRYICLTPNQTMTFLTSEQDPGTTGYLIAVAKDARLGCPVTFNHLIGDAFIKLQTGHAANLGAEAISGLAGGIPFCNANSVTARLSFDGVSYGLLPRVLASSSIPSRADGNDTLIVLNSMTGLLNTGVFSIGAIFGIVYDDAEHPHSFTLNSGCQLRFSLSNAAPRLTPRFETVIPAGQVGWMKLWATSDTPILGAQINFNPNSGVSAGAFSQGHNLHKRTLSAAGVLVVPIFPPNC